MGRLAGEIDADLRGSPVLLAGMLKGAVFFLCDLARRVRSPVTLDFLQASSYGTAMRSSGKVKMTRDLSIDIAGKHVVIVEDVVDTGVTLARVLRMLSARSPASLKVCALLRKKLPGAARIPVDYVGFDIDDRFVVGYGLDLAERFRNLPYVATLKGKEDDRCGRSTPTAPRRRSGPTRRPSSRGASSTRPDRSDSTRRR